MPRGQGRRCSGYLSSDGRFAYCTREEHAGQAMLEQTDPPSYRHILEGDCRCGAVHAMATFIEPITYDYHDEDNRLLYQVVREPNKQFKQRRPDGNGGWVWNLQNTRRVLYHLPFILEAVEAGGPIYIVEGEKDVHAVEKTKNWATCNPGGAGKWRSEYGDVVAGAKVIIVADKDEPGLAHARQIAETLPAATTTIVQAKTGKDVSDHLAAGHTLAELIPINLEGAERPRVFVDAAEFASNLGEVPPPLLGNADTIVIPAAGFCLLAGRPGAGKTTFLLDLVCHLAAGIPYPPADPENPKAPEPWDVPRPLRVALIENEGPLQMFQVKVAEKLEIFGHQLGTKDSNGGCLVIQQWRWGSFSFADEDAMHLARQELDDAQIDLVVGDPLGSFGSAGVGSPEDTRNFVALLRPLGLGTTRAFLFLHHFRERAEKSEDELARISGAWGGHLDTLITLSSGHHADQARLAYPKLRWAKTRSPKPIILGRIWNKASFEALAEEDDASLLDPILAAHLTLTREAGEGRNGQGWQTATEIAKATERRRTHVTKALEGNPALFMRAEKEEAKALGARANAILWGLTEWSTTIHEFPELDF